MLKYIVFLLILPIILSAADKVNWDDPNLTPIRTQEEIMKNLDKLDLVPLSWAYPWVMVTVEQKENYKLTGKLKGD